MQYEKYFALILIDFLLIVSFPQINTMLQDANFTATAFGQMANAVVPVLLILAIIVVSVAFVVAAFRDVS